MSVYVFGYGSLMNAESAGRALKRAVGPDELIPARLQGYRRSWALKERVRSEKLQREVTAVFLDLDPGDGAWSNGVIVEVSDAAFADLRLREKNYAPVEVTAAIATLPPDRAVPPLPAFTFVSRPEHRVSGGDGDLFVMERYVAMVAAACDRLGPGFAEDYARSTDPIPYPLLDGSYLFVDEKQAKHV